MGSLREDDRLHRAMERRAELSARRQHAMGLLLERREELSGVSPMADFLGEAVRWSA